MGPASQANAHDINPVSMFFGFDLYCQGGTPLTCVGRAWRLETACILAQSLVAFSAASREAHLVWASRHGAARWL